MTYENVKVGSKLIGEGKPTYVVAEIGINHNGDLNIAKQLILAAVHAGCDAVKFQKRVPDICTPRNLWNTLRETPWGKISYLEYRYKIEFNVDDYLAIDRFCKENKIDWFASCWDEESVTFLEEFDIPAYKIPSAALTDIKLLETCRNTGKPLIISTGMSEFKQIQESVNSVGLEDLILTHSTSIYPCPPNNLNLRVIKTLKKEFSCVVGYSGHETGISTTICAVALGASYIERHLTLDKNMWGSDHFASLLPEEFYHLVKEIRLLDIALGDGIKRVYPDEKNALDKLRRIL